MCVSVGECVRVCLFVHIAVSVSPEKGWCLQSDTVDSGLRRWEIDRIFLSLYKQKPALLTN